MNDLHEKELKKALFVLILATTMIRVFIASTMEFSVDEVYYWTYALYPDWSHFDHPPMVGLVIQLFSLNLFFDSELAIRLGPIIISALNTIVIFSIGKQIKDSLAGLYAALLLNASIYCSVLAGNFIIPDSPQLLFWLLSLKYLIIVLPKKTIDRAAQKEFLLACLFIGLAIISKYHGVFIWAGAGLYALIYNRGWFRQPVFYAGMLLSAAFTVPIIIWNIQNEWISFTFHGDRVTNELVLRFDYFFTEIFGQVVYNNPINYILIVMGLVAIFKKKAFINHEYLRILLLNFLPLWLVFTSFSLFRQTLPHWTAPAFTPLILIAAIFLSDKTQNQKLTGSRLLVPKILRSSLYLLYGLMLAAWLLINFYPGTIGEKNQIARYGNNDFTLDMFGWDQIYSGFERIVKEDISQGSMPKDAPIINPKYFPGTEIDYYVARPLGMKLLMPGKLTDIHKYAWINEARGNLKSGDDAYMISTSNWYKDPSQYYQDNFEQIIPSDTMEITRSGALAYYAFVYQMKGYKGNFPDPFNK